jgi:GT2 family glycosyltransferase
MSAPLGGVAVAISTRNRAAALDRCLTSLWSGERRPDEIVVVDQSDDDLTTAVVQDRRALGVPIVYVAQRARGLGASQNMAFLQARHEIVAVIDDDCVADARWLALIVSELGQRADVDGVTGRVLPLAADGERTFPVASRTSEVRREFEGTAFPWEVGSGNNFALRREAFLRCGGCDERLGPGSPAQGGVDMDLFYRLVRSGSRIIYDPRIIVYHERQTRAERKARRPMYGRGMGAAIALRHRSGDRAARSLLTAWIHLRLRLLRHAAGRGDWVDVRDEVTMLASTLGGLVHGWRISAATSPGANPDGRAGVQYDRRP